MFAAGKTKNIVANAVSYIEDVFSTYLYTGTSATRTITNGINESGKGALTWIKSRTSAQSHILNDTARGAGNNLLTDSTSESLSINDTLTAFGTTGFTLGADSNAVVNGSGQNYVSWSFREQPKFFDIVTWTGNGTNRTIAHNLGSVPACILVKSSSGGYAWAVYHSSLANTEYLVLNSSAAKATDATYWNSTTATSTEFSIGTAIPVNNSGANYVAYVFAHNAGGFGLTGTDNVISCGSFTTDGSGNATVNLGYEPQWLLAKSVSGSSPVGDWYMTDNMRGWSQSTDEYLRANSSGAAAAYQMGFPSAQGFTVVNGAYEVSTTYIYIAIRRGPMKVPTVGTSVFSPNIWSGTGTTQQITTGFFPDMFIGINRGAVHASTYVADILRGLDVTLATNLTSAENSASGNTFNMTGYSNNNGNLNSTFGGGQTYVGEFFRRAPSFFDEVCCAAPGFAITNEPHNLGVTPELFISKPRTNSGAWYVYGSVVGTTYDYLVLNDTGALQTSGAVQWGATSTTFSEPSTSSQNNYVTYLFATCAGVSKVGSYTGNGTTQTIDCGFGAGGARFVLIKRTDATGGWYVYDTARGMTVLTDPYLLLNSTAAETATLGSVTTVSTGFALNSTILAAINVSGGSYLFLAIS